MTNEMTNEEAIEILQKGLNDEGEIEIITRDGGCAVEIAIEALEGQKTGKWIHGREIWREHIGDAIVGIGYEDWRCSECNTLVKEDAQKILWKFCPYCGARMEGSEEDAEKL